MTARLKVPPYGKALLNERRLGRHPQVVHVHFCETWGCSAACEHCRDVQPAPWHPALQVVPAEFEPFRFDWTVVTGCMAAVFDWRQDWAATPTSRRFYELLGELGRYAGPVQVYRLEPEKPVHGEIWAWRFGLWFDAGLSAARSFRESGKWPFYWPPETEALNAPRRQRWWDLHDGREPAAA